MMINQVTNLLERPQMPKIITRSEAMEQGLPRYFTGKPCPSGHIVERITHCAHCTICKNEAQKKYMDSLEQEHKKAKYKNERLLSRYGISLDDYKKLIKEQKYRCKICNNRDRLVLDHCHIRNEFRGLICSRCNTMLGFAKDDIDILASGIEYLINFRESLDV